MISTTETLARHMSRLTTSLHCRGRFECIQKNFNSNSIYISYDDFEEWEDSPKVLSDLWQLNWPAQENLSASEQYLLFEHFLTALKPLGYAPDKSTQMSNQALSSPGYVEVLRNSAYERLSTDALPAKFDAKITKVPCLSEIFDCFATDAKYFIPTSNTSHRLTDYVFDSGVVVLEESQKQLTVLCYVINE